MAAHRFTVEQIERFDRIQNCLADQHCREVLGVFLTRQRNPNLLNAFKLWQLANGSTNFNEEMFLDLIDEVDGFNENPLLSISECHLKLSYVKQESSRLLERVLPLFVEYLNRHHRA